MDTVFSWVFFEASDYKLFHSRIMTIVHNFDTLIKTVKCRFGPRPLVFPFFLILPNTSIVRTACRFHLLELLEKRYVWRIHDRTSQASLIRHHRTLAYILTTCHCTLAQPIGLWHDHRTLGWPSDFGVFQIYRCFPLLFDPRWRLYRNVHETEFHLLYSKGFYLHLLSISVSGLS